MLFRSFESILEECLQAMKNGASVEACVALYPKQEKRLRPYLELAERVSEAPRVLPRPVAQAAAWNLLRNRAVELRAGKWRRPSMPSVSYGSWLRPVAAVFVAMAVLVATTSGAALASQDALPDSPLYRVKLATEEVHLMFVFDDENEARILLDQSQERTDEIRAMTRDGKELPGSVLDALRDRNERAAEIIADEPEATDLRDRLRGQALAQERLLVAVQSDVSRSASSDYREAFAAVHNSYFIGTGAITSSLLSEQLANGVQTVSGVVKLELDGSWSVGGISVGVDGRTISQQDLVDGATAELTLGISSNGRRHALSVNRISTGPDPANTIVSGEIEEATEDHIVIAGQTIPITQETFLRIQPKKGKKVSVRLNTTEEGVVAGTVSAAPQPSGAIDNSGFTIEGEMETDLGQETRQMVVSGMTFAITTGTSFDFTAGNAGEGVRVLVKGVALEGGALEARSLTVLAADPGGNSVYLIGVFDGARPGIWDVGGLDLESPSGNAQPPQSGSLIAVDAIEDDGLLTVRDLWVIQTPEQNLIRVEGTATNIDDFVWNFGFGQVRVDSTAEVSGNPVEGGRAVVWGSKESTGSIDAVYVRMLDQRSVVTPPADGDADDD